MRCTHCGSAMTPTHTRRRGRLYRYYVCLGASRRGHDTCPVRSIAASEVEGLVLVQVRRLLASPELVARTIVEAMLDGRQPRGLRLSRCWGSGRSIGVSSGPGGASGGLALRKRWRS